MARIFNFSAGPAALPESVLLKAQAELQSLNAMPQAQDAAGATPPDDPAQPGAAAGADHANQLEALKQSLQKAIELAPTAQQHSEAAGNHLKEEDLAAALVHRFHSVGRNIAANRGHESQILGLRGRSGAAGEAQNQGAHGD